MCKEASVDIPDTVIDRAHRIGKTYTENKTKKSCKSIILRFTTFRHRTMDLTKKRYSLLMSANKFVANHDSVKFCYADINFRRKIKWSDDSVSDAFFNSLNELNEIVSDDQ